MSGPSSGSRFSVSGVGTQTMIASTLASAAKRVEAVIRSPTRARSSEGTSSM